MNEFGKMDIWVKGVSNEIGIEPDLWRVVRKSIAAGTSKDTIEVTMDHRLAGTRRLAIPIKRGTEVWAGPGSPPRAPQLVGVRAGLALASLACNTCDNTAYSQTVFDCGRVLFGSRVAKREAEGTVHTKHQLNLDPNPEGT